MRQVVDALGNKIVGLFKKDDGSIVVADSVGFSRAVGEKFRADEVMELRARLEHLEAMLNKLIQ